MLFSERKLIRSHINSLKVSSLQKILQGYFLLITLLNCQLKRLIHFSFCAALPMSAHESVPKIQGYYEALFEKSLYIHICVCVCHEHVVTEMLTYQKTGSCDFFFFNFVFLFVLVQPEAFLIVACYLTNALAEVIILLCFKKHKAFTCVWFHQ